MVDVEFVGQFYLVSFVVAGMVDEIVLGEIIPRMFFVCHGVGKGELRLGESGTVFSRNATIGSTVPCSSAKLVRGMTIPANSLAKVDVKFRQRGLALPRA